MVLYTQREYRKQFHFSPQDDAESEFYSTITMPNFIHVELLNWTQTEKSKDPILLIHLGYSSGYRINYGGTNTYAYYLIFSLYLFHWFFLPFLLWNVCDVPGHRCGTSLVTHTTPQTFHSTSTPLKEEAWVTPNLLGGIPCSATFYNLDFTLLREFMCMNVW